MASDTPILDALDAYFRDEVDKWTTLETLRKLGCPDWLEKEFYLYAEKIQAETRGL